jgi:hypothetical protein
MNDDRPRSCFTCVHLYVCKWTPARGANPLQPVSSFMPFRLSMDVKEYLNKVTAVTAEACAEFILDPHK